MAALPRFRNYECTPALFGGGGGQPCLVVYPLPSGVEGEGGRVGGEVVAGGGIAGERRTPGPWSSCVERPGQARLRLRLLTLVAASCLVCSNFDGRIKILRRRVAMQSLNSSADLNSTLSCVVGYLRLQATLVQTLLYHQNVTSYGHASARWQQPGTAP